MAKYQDDLVNHRYTFVHSLTSSCYFGDVYQAVDKETQSLVMVLKLPPHVVVAIGQEKIRLRAMLFQDPALPMMRVDTVYTLEDGMYVIYEEQQGALPLLDYLQGKSFTQAMETLTSLCEAVALLHERKMWHGGLVPQTVWVLPNGAVRLMTMLSDSPDELASVCEDDESIQFFAPETLVHSPFDSRTDIYTLGVLFYFVLTGRMPQRVDGNSLHSPSRFNQHIPPQLDRMILKMINRKPIKRYQWIRQVTVELSRMIGRVLGSVQEQTHLYGSEHLFSAEFTGRDEEMAELSRIFEGVAAGRSQAVLLLGRKGVGRKRLIYEVYGHFQKEVVLITGRAKPNRQAILEDIVSRLLVMCFSTPKLESVGQRFVGRLSRLFPSIAVEYSDKVAFVVEKDEQNPGVYVVLYEFMSALLKERSEPLIFVLFDAHLLDHEMLALLKKLYTGTQHTIGLIGVAETDLPELVELFQEQLHIEPLPLWQLRECVRSRLGNSDFVDERFVQWLNFHAQGSLYQLFYLLEFLADTQQIYLDRDMWYLGVPLEKLQIPQSDSLSYRLEQLKPEKRRLCQLMSLFQHNISLEAIGLMMGVETPHLMQMVHKLEEQRLLVRAPHRYQFSSDHLKAQMYATIPEAERTDLHRRLADCLLVSDSKDYNEIVYHCEQGSMWRRAIVLHIWQARHCFKHHILDEAERHIRKAIELYAKLPDAACPDVLTAFLAKTVGLVGKRQEAARLYLDLYQHKPTLRVFCEAMVYATAIRYHMISPYIDFIREKLESDELTLKQRVFLMIANGIYELEAKRNYAYIYEMEEYHKKYGTLLREKLNVKDYFRWIFRLHQLLKYAPGVTWEQRARYLYEGATIAEHYNMRRELVPIYTTIALDLRQRSPMKSKEYYLKAAQIATEVADKHNLVVIYNNLADMYCYLGDMYHSYMYLEKANEMLEGNSNLATALLQHEVEISLFVEDHAKATRAVEKLAMSAKRKGLANIRLQAFLYRFQIVVELGKERSADRMWPMVKRIYAEHPFENESLLRAKYDLLKGRCEPVISEFNQLIHVKDIDTDLRITRMMILIQAYLLSGRYQEGLEMAMAAKKVITTTGYFGYIAWAHFYIGRFYQMLQQPIPANLNYKRAMIWFRKLNHQSRLMEIDKYMNQDNQQMIRLTDETIDGAGGEQKSVPAFQLLEAPEQPTTAVKGQKIKRWVRNIVSERDEMVDSLTENEILFDAIRRISSSIMIKEVCQNLAAVVFDQMLIDKVHLYVRMGEQRVEMIHLDEQLRLTTDSNPEVSHLIHESLNAEQAIECTGGGAFLYAIPIFSHDQNVVCVMVLERHSIQSPYTERDKRFILNLAQLVSSNIENAIMYEAMITDNLTGLYLRNYFMKRLNEEFIKVKRYGIDLSFLMLDLDNFSLINNSYGHNEGDRVLRQVAQTILQSVRMVDIVGRFGGEELIIILPNTSGPSAKIVGERILHNLRSIPIEGNRYKLTASIGIGSCDMDNPIDPLDLIEMADKAETFAKKTGKDRLVCHWEMKELERNQSTNNKTTSS